MSYGYVIYIMSVGMTIINNYYYYSLNIIKTLSRICTFLFCEHWGKNVFSYGV